MQLGIHCSTLKVKGGVVMATKTANVTARIQPDIKESAEAILEKLGIPGSVFIDMTYRQVISANGIPFELKVSREIEISISLETFNSKGIPLAEMTCL